MQQRILPGRGSGGLSWTCAGRHGLALGGELLQRRPQPVEVVDDALHGELRRVALLHRAGDVDDAAIGHQARQNLAIRSRLKQHKLHDIPPLTLWPEYSTSPGPRPAAAARQPHIRPRISGLDARAARKLPPPAGCDIVAPDGAGRIQRRPRQPKDSDNNGCDQGNRHRLRAPARARSRPAGGIPRQLRAGQERQDQQRDLLSRHRPGAPRPHHREGRSEVRRHRLSRRERGRPQDARQGARRLRHREPRRARRRQARAPDRAERLPDRGGLGHGQGAGDSGAAPDAQLRLRAARARRRR